MPLMAEVPSATAQETFKMLVLRSGTVVTGFANRCAHFGVPLASRPQLLIYTPHASITCNVHYARYRWSDGLCVSGDCAGESLVPVPVHVDVHGDVRIGSTP